jgi:hypothetical protein
MTSDLDRLAGAFDRRLALAALHAVAETLEREPVFLAARGARDDYAAVIYLNVSCHGPPGPQPRDFPLEAAAFAGLDAAGALFDAIASPRRATVMA